MSPMVSAKYERNDNDKIKTKSSRLNALEDDLSFSCNALISSSSYVSCFKSYSCDILNNKKYSIINSMVSRNARNKTGMFKYDKRHVPILSSNFKNMKLTIGPNKIPIEKLPMVNPVMDAICAFGNTLDISAVATVVVTPTTLDMNLPINKNHKDKPLA